MMAYFDPSKKNIAVNDVKSLFRKLDKVRFNPILIRFNPIKSD